MLTGDLNCALVPWIVQYRIGDPYKFLFKVRSVNETLRDLSEAIMRQVVGDRTINEVITERLELATAGKMELQRVLNDAETGITVVNLELKKTTVPEPVQPSFNEVNQAMQEKEKMIYQAREAYNKIIPEAKGEAERNIKNAEGYALERVNRAKGDANRFLMQWKEYSRAKDVTRRRLYLEAMGEVIPRLGTKYILDSEQSGLLPLLNLGAKGGGE
jgi:membrane protease subunit HflK